MKEGKDKGMKGFLEVTQMDHTEKGWMDGETEDKG